jgi:hypothetical protein
MSLTARDRRLFANRDTVRERIYCLYRDVVYFKLPHTEVLTRWSEIRQSKEFPALPNYIQSELRGLFNHLFHGPADLSIYQHLYFAYDVDGQVMTFDQWRKDNPDADPSTVFTTDNGHHYWKGTTKEY